MGFLYIILLVLLFSVILFFTVLLKIVFTLDTREGNVKLVLLWLYPFIRVTAEGSASVPRITVYLFKKEVYSGRIKAGKKRGIGAEIVKASAPTDIRMDIAYGFGDPYVTGMACGSISAASELAGFVEVRQQPDFISNEDYICLDASARVNVGNTILNYLKAKIKNKT